MPVRRRGVSWQLDIRTAEGTRIRRQYATEQEALEAEASIKPNPTQRAEARKQRRRSLARKKATSVTTGSSSATASSGIVAISAPAQSNLITLPESVQRGRNTCPLHGVPCIVCYGPHFAQSVPLQQRMEESLD